MVEALAQTELFQQRLRMGAAFAALFTAQQRREFDVFQRVQRGISIKD
jgi:acyl-CoA thioesterase-1